MTKVLIGFICLSYVKILNLQETRKTEAKMYGPINQSRFLRTTAAKIQLENFTDSFTSLGNLPMYTEGTGKCFGLAAKH